MDNMGGSIEWTCTKKAKSSTEGKQKLCGFERCCLLKRTRWPIIDVLVAFLGTGKRYPFGPPPPPQGYRTPSLTKASAMIRPSGEMSGIVPRSRAATCVKSRGASRSQINLGMGMCPTWPIPLSTTSGSKPKSSVTGEVESRRTQDKTSPAGRQERYAGAHQR